MLECEQDLIDALSQLHQAHGYRGIEPSDKLIHEPQDLTIRLPVRQRLIRRRGACYPMQRRLPPPTDWRTPLATTRGFPPRPSWGHFLRSLFSSTARLPDLAWRGAPTSSRLASSTPEVAPPARAKTAASPFKSLFF